MQMHHTIQHPTYAHGISHIDNLEHIKHTQEDEIENKMNELKEPDTLQIRTEIKK